MGQFIFFAGVLSLSALSVVICNAAGGGTGDWLLGTWAVGRRRAWRVGGQAADTARQASTVIIIIIIKNVLI